MSERASQPQREKTRRLSSERLQPKSYVALFSLDDRNQLQMLLAKNERGVWGLPGGSIQLSENGEPLESAEAAGVREVFEEIHVRVTDCEPVVSTPTLNVGTNTHFYVAIGEEWQPQVVRHADAKQEVFDVRSFTFEEIQKMAREGKLFNDLIVYAFDLAVVTLNEHIHAYDHNFTRAFCEEVQRHRERYLNRQSSPHIVDLGVLGAISDNDFSSNESSIN